MTKANADHACAELSRYLENGLADSDRASFETHLEGCAACTAEVRTWQATLEGVSEWAEARRLGRATAAEADKLVQRASVAPDQGWDRRLLLAVAAAAALLLVGLGLTMLWDRDVGRDELASPGARLPELATLHASGAVVKRDGARVALEVPGEGRLFVATQQDRFALSAHSAVTVARVKLPSGDGNELQLSLHRGSVAVGAGKRSREDRLVVQAGAHRVVVVGTRFRVTRRPGPLLEVLVDEGQVRVEGAGLSQLLAAGQVLQVRSRAAAKKRAATPAERRACRAQLRTAAEQGAAKDADLAASGPTPTPQSTPPLPVGPTPTPPAMTTPPMRATTAPPARPKRDLATWRSWVLVGQYERARKALTAHLSRMPADAGAWSVLADCHRKQGRWADALAAQRRIIRHGGPAAANRARYRAAVLAQDRLGRHAVASRLLAQFLARAGASNALRPHALLRRARCLRSLGRGAQARRLLQELVRRHPGSGPALKARHLLKKKAGGTK